MRAFVTSEFSPEALQKLRELLKDEVIYESWRDTQNLYFNESELIKKINDAKADIFICEGDNVKTPVIEGINVKIIGSTRDDPNNIAVATATKKGIPVLFAPKRNTVSVAELTIAVILELCRNLAKTERYVHSDKFKVSEFKDYVKTINLFKGIELYGKTVGIVGLGAIGFEVAKRLLPFGVKFLVFDPYVPPARLTAIGAKSVELDTLMAESDIITLHCPPIDETDGMISAQKLALMKPTAFFVNLARASVTDEAALLELLKAKKIAGAALDVFTVEPLDENNEFLKLDNCICTPHVGGNTTDTNHRHGMMMVEGIAKILNHQIPDNCKNPEVLPGYPKAEPMKVDGAAPIPAVPSSLQYYAAQGQEIVNVCNKMVEKGFIIAQAGNVSMRVKLPNGEDAFLMTASSKDYDGMRIEDLVLVDANGKTLLGTRNPTSERRMHVKVYLARPDINAIIHSHASYSTALSIARQSIGPFVDEIIPFIGGCEVAEFGLAGTDELADNVVKALGENYAAFVANHGNICCGASMGQAWNIINLVEHAAKTQYRAMMLGTVYALPEEAEEHGKEIFGIMKDANSAK